MKDLGKLKMWLSLWKHNLSKQAPTHEGLLTRQAISLIIKKIEKMEESEHDYS